MPVIASLSLLGLIVTSLPILHLNVDSLSPIKDARRAQGKLLRGDLGYWYGGRMLIVTGADKEAVLQMSESISPHLDKFIGDGILEGYDMASQFIPSKRRQQQNLEVFRNPERCARIWSWRWQRPRLNQGLQAVS